MSLFECSEMRTLVSLRYFVSAAARAKAQPKKVASYLEGAEIGKRVVEEEQDLNKVLKSKRDPATLLNSNYDPIVVEQYWNKWWESRRFFHADEKKALKLPYDQKFVIVIPPPNVTGSLHIGHALTMAVEDCIVRW